MKQYLDILQKILDEGIEKNDRTGVGTLSIFGTQSVYNLEKGQFPLITTKKVSIKGMIEELRWFIKGDTNINFLLNKNIHIWDSWADSDGDIGKAYGYQWRRLFSIDEENIVIVKRKTFIDNYVEKKILPELPIDDGKEICGKIFKNLSGLEYRVINYVETVDDQRIYRIQFINSGFITKASSREIKRGRIKDLYNKSVCGIGYLGDITKKERSLSYYDRARRKWQGIIERCYNPKNSMYSGYGAVGITVCKRWHKFSNFLSDLRNLDNFYEWKKEGSSYDLDKDFYGSNIYSPDTCIFLPKSLNQSLVAKQRPVEYNGKLYLNREKLCNSMKDFGWNSSELSMYLSGKIRYKKYAGVKDVKLNEDEIVRPKLKRFDQLDYILSEIKQNPNSRRLILNSWNPKDIDEMALPPCHMSMQFYVRNGFLDLQLYQRSADWFLGVPWNISEYSLLLMMVAQVTGLKPGRFIHTTGDTHLYLNTIEQAKLQLTREPKELPIMKINPNVKCIDDFVYEDFELVGYDPWPHIKAEVAV